MPSSLLPLNTYMYIKENQVKFHLLYFDPNPTAKNSSVGVLEEGTLAKRGALGLARLVVWGKGKKITHGSTTRLLVKDLKIVGVMNGAVIPYNYDNIHIYS